MQTTTNYGLKKPEETDFYNVQDFNDNMDILDEKVKECFQSVSNGKKLIASAITDKGVTTASDATFAVMAENIENIETSPNLQAKTETLDTTKTSAILTPDSGYDGLSKVTVSITTQSKSAVLSTSAQTIKPDSGKVLSAVSIPAIEGTAAVGDVLAGKTFNSATAGMKKPGTMVNRKGATVDAIAVSQDDTYTYFKTPAGCYSEESMVRTENSNLGGKYFVVYNSAIESNIINSFIGKSIALIGQYPAHIGSANSGIKTNHYIVACNDGKGTTYVSEKAVDVTNKTALCISGRQSLGTSAQIKIGLSKTPNPSSLSDFVKTITVSNTTENVQFDVSDIIGDYYLCFALYLSCHYRIDSIVLI